MPYTVFVASDVFGRKTNLELEFPFAPTMAELTNQTEVAFSAEQNTVRPGTNQPYMVSKFHIVDEISDDWVEVTGANQLRNFCQLYSFQPHSTRYTESQGHIPPAKKGVMSYGGANTSRSPTSHSPGWQQQHASSGPYGAPTMHSPSGPMGASPTNRGYSQPPMNGTPSHRNGSKLPENIGHDEKVRIAFEELDANKNRVIEPDEFSRSFRVCGLEFTTATCDDLFHKADFDKDGNINWTEWQRFCELYPALLDSLYYRLKAHWEHLQETGRIDAFKTQRPSLEDRERQAQQALEQAQQDADDLARRQNDADNGVADAQDRARGAEDAARDGAQDIDRARQNKADKERDLQNEKERERQAQQRAAESGREMDDANRRAAVAQQAADQAEAAEKRALDALQNAQREKEKQQAIADQAKRDAAGAQDRHNQIIGDIPRTVENAKGALTDADREMQAAEQRQRDLNQKAHELQQAVNDAQRRRDELARQLQAAKDRQDPNRRALTEAKNAVSDHDRQVADMEERLIQEDARKKALLDEEKSIVQQEVELRQQRENLEAKEGELRTAHTSFFHAAGRQSPGRSRSPTNAAYGTPGKNDYRPSY
eukprot:TRINITY_DN571_c0_g2_i1.p1 TRINITY_DN571_c0_g2~~TRINITY_DN571_c0_g2_i1.p1  ORF type:complete len:599 (+),score=199.07 TRINITY_DN571_c0_g2_i1:62-1858(+)